MIIAEKYLTIMAGVLLADGKVTEEENSLFQNMMKQVGLNVELQDYFQKLLSEKTTISTDKLLEISKGMDKYLLLWIIKDAFYIALSDGEISDEEIQFLKQFLEKCNIDMNKIEAILDWGEEAVEHLKHGYFILSD